MADEQPGPLERALGEMERQADTALRTADRLVAGLKSLKSAARQGEVRKLRAANDAIKASFGTLDQHVANVADAWQFDEESYLREGYVSELLAEARRQGVDLSLQDERLYTYPLLIGVEPARRAVTIDRKIERRIRPSTLVGIIRQRKEQPARFRPETFLRTLYAAYDQLTRNGREGTVVPLTEIYNLLTLMPSVRRDYALGEFARDVYLLDDSGVSVAPNGAMLSFHASTGTRSGRRVLHIVTKEGAEKRYYGISFSKAQAGDALEDE